MDTKEIFRALQSDKITVQQAYNELATFLDQSPQEEGGDQGKRKEKEALTLQDSVVDCREIEPGIVQVSMQDRKHKNTFSTELISGLMQAFESLKKQYKLQSGYPYRL